MFQCEEELQCNITPPTRVCSSLTSIRRSKVWLSLLITQWQITSVQCPFHGSKSVFRWHNLHRGDVLLLKISSEGAQPVAVLALVQAMPAVLPWWPHLTPDSWEGEEDVGGTWIFDHFGRCVHVLPCCPKLVLVMPFIIKSAISGKWTLLTQDSDNVHRWIELQKH